jgi:hypothetical protein
MSEIDCRALQLPCQQDPRGLRTQQLEPSGSQDCESAGDLKLTLTLSVTDLKSLARKGSRVKGEKEHR